MDELLALVGGSWPQLLLYPGLLSSVLATLIMHALWSRRGLKSAQTRHTLVSWETGDVLGAACVLLVMALLPLPRTYWAYPIDALIALALLEASHWVRLRRWSAAPQESTRATVANEAAALLNVYLLLALALAALGQASGSLLLPDLRSGQPLLRWAGLMTWAIALPPLLGLGPWYSQETDDWFASLRRVAHIALLVAIALPADDTFGHPVTALATLLAFGSLTVLHYAWRGDSQRWERWQPLIASGLLGILLGVSGAAWLGRLG